MDKSVKKQSVKARIRQNSVVLISFMIAIAVVSLFGLIKINSDYKYMIANFGNSQGTIGKVGIEFGELKTNVRNMVLEADMDKMLVIQQQIKDNIKTLDDYVIYLNDSCVTPEEQVFYVKMKDAYHKYVESYNQVESYALAFQNDDAFAEMNNVQLQYQKIVKENIDGLLQLQIDNCAKTEKSATIMAYALIALIAIAVAGATFVGITRSTKLSKGICDPLDEMVTAADNLANGNLHISVKADTEDEIGSLAKSFSHMIDNLNMYIGEISRVTNEMSNYNMAVEIKENFVGDFSTIKSSINNFTAAINESLSMIKQAAGEIASGSGQVAEGAQSLAEGTTEEASVVEELVATITDVSSKVNSNASNAKEAGKLSGETHEIVALGTRQMDAMVKAMEDIQSSTNEIGAIIKSIADIASQTNLLSLNASIEAARAGEAGRGFAVVAGEIGSLAEQSDKATKDTAALIEKCMNMAKVGAETVEETAKTLERIVTSTESVSVLVNQISDASEAQAEALNEVVTGINQVSSVIQSNSAISEESAAASEELNSQADVLAQTVDNFNLKI